MNIHNKHDKCNKHYKNKKIQIVIKREKDQIRSKSNKSGYDREKTYRLQKAQCSEEEQIYNVQASHLFHAANDLETKPNYFKKLNNEKGKDFANIYECYKYIADLRYLNEDQFKNKLKRIHIFKVQSICGTIRCGLANRKKSEIIPDILQRFEENNLWINNLQKDNMGNPIDPLTPYEIMKKSGY